MLWARSLALSTARSSSRLRRPRRVEHRPDLHLAGPHQPAGAGLKLHLRTNHRQTLSLLAQIVRAVGAMLIKSPGGGRTLSLPALP